MTSLKLDYILLIKDIDKNTFSLTSVGRWGT